MATAIAPSIEQQWHEERRKGIGGSEVHHLFPALNLADKDDTGSRYGCPRRLSYEKLGIEPDYQYTPETLRLFERGHIMEEYAADRYMEKAKVRVFRSAKSWTSPNHPFMRCFIDRRIKKQIGLDGVMFIRVLECKSANEHVANRMEVEGLPISYALQIQHSIECTQSDAGAFAVIVVPDFVDAVIEQIDEGPLRTRILNLLAPGFDFFSFECERDESLIGLIVEKEAAFWNLIEQKKLADPLPELNDERCTTCTFRKTCRGEAYAQANAKVPIRDKKSGIQYVQIEEPEFVQTVADRLAVMKVIDEQEQILAGIDNELKQRFPAEIGAVQIPGTGVKIRWNYQKGATRWDSDALKADSLTIGNYIAFGRWLMHKKPDLAVEWGRETGGNHQSLADQYQKQGAPTRPFVFDMKGVK